MMTLQIVSVIVVLKCKEKFLLVRRSESDDIFPGKWQNMGGKVELGETVESAIRREVKEETGLDINESPAFLQSYSWKKDKQSPVRLGLIFLINLRGKFADYKIKLCDELSEYAWVEFAEALKMNKQNKLIGKESATGTLAQLRLAKMLQ